MGGRAEAGLCELLGELRPERAEGVPDSRNRAAVWYRVVDSDAIGLVRRGDTAGARRRVRGGVAERSGRTATAVVSLVGAGAGEPGLITVQGLELLRAADVGVYHRRLPA